MSFSKTYTRFSFITAILLFGFFLSALAQLKENGSELDKKVESFLDRHQYRWHDMNIPTEDGKLLYELIVKNNYTNVVEIGTSTGHSAIWIAWALSKTGGKLITLEINESRQQKALANFKEAGVDGYIDSRLGDAHKLVPQLKEPIDFVFCDADKSWYKNYFKSLKSKISPGGCFAAHNVTRQNPDPAIMEFLKYADKLSDYKTTIENQSSSGVSLSFRQK